MGSLSLDEVLVYLLDLMRKNGLSWVALQVQEQIRAGKPVMKSIEKKPATRQSNLFSNGAGRKSGNARNEVHATEEYSPSERIQIAVSALENAVIHGTEVRREVHQFFGSKLASDRPVRFEPEELEEAQSLEIGPLTPDQTSSMDKLQQLVQTLRREL